ncbi:MAG: DUF1853 family protein, partial [Deltaproteobacteria bacterium]|nr:DUF1853 family protein [Deltaproteobacteria bacterium]
PAQGLFIGPEGKDRLDLKAAKILGQQLPLAGRLATPPAESLAFVKGALFLPLGSSGLTPAGASPSHLRGWWIRHGEKPKPSRGGYRVLEKRFWLAGRSPAPALDEQALARECDAHFARDQRSLMVAELDESGGERSRGFIAAKSWPVLPGPVSA